MKNILKLSFIVILATFFISCTAKGSFNSSENSSTGPSHGEVSLKDGKQQAWDDRDKKFVSLEQFWRDYAKRTGGLTWGQSSKYPPYNEVKEHDLFMVEIGNEICLMEFFHDRWRRANDVRRWDLAFNEFSACAKVFD